MIAEEKCGKDPVALSRRFANRCISNSWSHPVKRSIRLNLRSKVDDLSIGTIGRKNNERQILFETQLFETPLLKLCVLV